VYEEHRQDVNENIRVENNNMPEHGLACCTCLQSSPSLWVGECACLLCSQCALLQNRELFCQNCNIVVKYTKLEKFIEFPAKGKLDKLFSANQSLRNMIINFSRVAQESNNEQLIALKMLDKQEAAWSRKSTEERKSMQKIRKEAEELEIKIAAKAKKVNALEEELKKLHVSEIPETTNNALVQKSLLVCPVDTRLPVKIESKNLSMPPDQSDQLHQARGPIVDLAAVSFGGNLGQVPFLKNCEDVENVSNGKAASSTEPGFTLVSNPRLDLSLLGVTGLDPTLSSIQSCKALSQVLDHKNDKDIGNSTNPLRVPHSKLANRQQVGKVRQSDVNQRGSWLKEEEGENKMSSKHGQKSSQHASEFSPMEEVKIPNRNASQLERTGSKNAINLIQSRLTCRTYNLLNPAKSTSKPVSSSGENYSDPLKIKLPRDRKGASSATHPVEPNANKEYNSRGDWSRNRENQGQIHMGDKVYALGPKKWKLASRSK